MTELELWGGCECTVNRVGSAWHDQSLRSGHHDRLEDLDLLAEAGCRAVRYPVLWERIAPQHPDQFDWRWTDERLTRLNQLGVRPIAGLVHHGSGPRYTNLLDGRFAEGLAHFAAAAAERYPWVTDWTPVNEPVTTARFSALYGHWYPHVKDETAFWAALLNQIDATRLAMAAIRKVNPQARLIQTEDLGRTYATRPLEPQADFDNARRWMSWDLLTGRLTRDHALYDRLASFGFADRLDALADDPCPPDVIGVNHYLTSDRFLDHRLHHYPPERRGGNDWAAFADVEAVRVLQPPPDGLEGALTEAWDRYGLPLAVTEAHNGCTREDQIRWVRDAWATAGRLKARGVDMRGVTVWAFLGSYDWNSLLTLQNGHYECGAYDLRGPEPRKTAIASYMAELSKPEPMLPPAAEGPGWWKRDVRLQFQPYFRSVETPQPRASWASQSSGRPILICGASGTLGKAFARSCEWRGLAYVLTARNEADVCDPASLEAAFDRYDPWAVVNATGYVRVDDAEHEPDLCAAINTHAAVGVAQACTRRDLPNAVFSSDLVFDGKLGRPYGEGDATAPLNAYGRSKADAERAILAMGGPSLIVRTAAFFSPYDPYNFASQLIKSLREGHPFAAAPDALVSPTYVPDLVDATLDLLIDGEHGLWHLTNPGGASWWVFGRMIAKAMGLDEEMIRPASFPGHLAPRPADVRLTSERGVLLPTLENAIERMAATLLAAEFLAEEEAAVDRYRPLPRRPFLAASA